MKKATILLIGNYFVSERTNKNVWHSMAEHLMARGWDVITTSNKINRVFRFLDMIWAIIRFREKFVLAQVDVFSGLSFIWVQTCVSLLKFLKKPVILTLHGGRLPEFAAKNSRRVHKTLNEADVVISPSPYHQNALKEYRKDIRFIPNPTDLSAAIYKKRINLKPWLIWVRAFHKIYNPDLAVEVVGALIKDYPDLKLIMVGPDKGDGSLQRMMHLGSELDVLDHIDIVGGVSHSEIPKILDKADIFINTSQYDTAPRSVLEAMAGGLCVVSTNVGGIPWLIQDGKNGILVPPNDIDQMADGVRRLLDEPDLAAGLSENAHHAVEGFDWDSVIERWERVFIEVIGKTNE